MNINQLPPNCFGALMSHLSLQERIQLRIVCKHWKAAIEEMCRETRSLKLFGSLTDALTYCIMLASYCLNDMSFYSRDFNLKPIGHDDELFGKDSPTSSCHFLVSLFPNVKQLTIGFPDPAKIDVPFLLSKWSLEFFTLRHDLLSKSLLKAIDNHKSLKSLNLFNDAYQQHAEHLKFPKVKLAILDQVEHFSFGKYSGDMVQVLRQLGPNIKHLIFGEMHTTTSMWKQLFTIKPEWSRSLTHLTIMNTDPLPNTPTHKDLLEFICSHLTSLNFLNFIDAYRMPLDYVFVQLARLPNLNHVCIYTNKGCQNFEKTINKLNQLPKLNSVKILQLYPDNLFVADDFARIFPQMFPNIEQLIVKAGNVLLGRKIQILAQTRLSHLRQYTYRHAQRFLRSLAFTGRHANEYDEFLYERQLDWESRPLTTGAHQQFIDQMFDSMADDCVIS